MKIEKAIVGGSGINFEITSVNQHAQGSLNGERNAIHQTMRDLNGVNSEGANAIALAAFDGVKLRLLEQAVLFEFVFDISKREFRAIDGNRKLGQHPG